MIVVPDHRWVRRGLALAAGLLICFAMPPWGWWPLAPVGIGLWALLLDAPRARTRFWTGALAGLGWFLPSTVWMVTLSAPGWVIGVGVWFPVVCGLSAMACPPTRLRFGALAGVLILGEWVRWHAPFGGVPLSMLAMTQGRGPLLPLARVTGSLGVSAGVAVVGGAVGALAAGSRRIPAMAVAAVAVVTVVGVVAPRGHVVRSIEVAAVQGGGQQGTTALDVPPSVVFQRHVDATREVTGPVDLIVWPEDVVNLPTWQGSYEQSVVAGIARTHHATMVVGVVENRGSATRFYNAAVAVGPDGNDVARYDKVRRVPFGEYVPLRPLITPFGPSLLPPRDAVPGTGPAVLHTPVGTLGVMVSWEDFFGRRARDAMHNGAEILLNPTNGASYWLTEVQTQQLASSSLRAVESGRWLVQAAPTGFSAIVDPDGTVVERTSISARAVLQRRVELRSGNTWAAEVGDLPALLVAVALLAGAWRTEIAAGGVPTPWYRRGAPPT